MEGSLVIMDCSGRELSYDVVEWGFNYNGMSWNRVWL